MDFVHDFDSDIAYVLEECEKRVLSYPSNIRAQGHRYLEKLHLLKDKNQSGGFCYLMPFWLMNTFKIERDICRNIASGNVFGLLYFMSQDDVMDNFSDKANASILPLSSLFFTDFISSYRSLFPVDSIFWSYFDRYMREWAESVVWERENHWGTAAEYSEEDLIKLSRKAAAMKIPFAALCVLSDRLQEIESFSKMMDYDQIVYQMIDDWRDWKEDLKRGSYTYLLVQAMKYCKLQDASQLTEGHVKNAVFMGDAGEKVFEMAKNYNRLSLESIDHIDSPYLKSYIALE
jgi:hypothetical protein